MRTLKLQVQISVDGFIAGPNGELDWLTWHQDARHQEFIVELHDTVDTILLGGKMAQSFVDHWEDVLDNQPGSPDHAFAKKMVDTPKVVFSKTLETPVGKNTSLARGRLEDELAHLKREDGKDIIVYGGASLVASLIRGGHIDEFNLFVNPVLINEGLRIFGSLTHRQPLTLISSRAYDNGVAILRYRRDPRT